MKTTAIELARRAVDLGQLPEAVRGYALSLQLRDQMPLSPPERLEAAAFLLEHGEDYHVPYDALLDLYEEGACQRDVLSILLDAFYAPNERELQERYARNVHLLKKYPYLFRRDFPAFSDLPLIFFPYEDDVYLPFDTEEGRFLPREKPREEIIRHWFFRDLSRPVLAEEIVSQYELEYLADNVRASEDVGYENHIYLHYASWERFCAFLQLLDLRPLLQRSKAVFLIGEEKALYPLDFRARFGIDYSQYPLKPVGVREITRLIWHAQLSYHNGGDFFNEIFDAHPNLLVKTSVWMEKHEEEANGIKDYSLEDALEVYRGVFDNARSLSDALELLSDWKDPRLVRELFSLKDLTDKDILVAWFLSEPAWNRMLDPASRITPVVFFQPHFNYHPYALDIGKDLSAVPRNDQEELLYRSKALLGFKYIKTFLPIRRMTTSWGASIRYLYAVTQSRLEELRKKVEENGGPLGSDDDHTVNIPDCFADAILFRGYLRDPDNRLHRDAVVVRFEDSKLNPRATFTALARMLDVPYTESMTYCSQACVRYPDNVDGSGFNTAAVYRSYDEYVNDSERCCMEYLMQDLYRNYGYDFLWYDGGSVDEARMQQWLDHTETADQWLLKLQELFFEEYELLHGKGEWPPEKRKRFLRELKENYGSSRRVMAKMLMLGLHYVNESGKPMTMQPLLQPDPALLEQPLYH